MITRKYFNGQSLNEYWLIKSTTGSLVLPDVSAGCLMCLFYRTNCLVLTKLQMLKKALKVFLLKSNSTPLSSYLKHSEWVVPHFRLLLNHSANTDKSHFIFLWSNMKKILLFLGTFWNSISFTLFYFPGLIKILAATKSTVLRATQLHLGTHLCLRPLDMTATVLIWYLILKPP